MARTHAGIAASAPGLIAAMLVLAGGTHGLAQDSVALTPGASDALPAKAGPQRSRFVVDLVPVASSWGNAFSVAPVLKASADADPMFATQLLGSAAASVDVLEGSAFPATDFSVWNTPGPGINPDANAAPGTLSVSSFDRQFAIAFSDLSLTDTNAIGAIVGLDEANPSRLFVTRVVGMTSGLVGAPPFSTISLGAIDANGNLALRFDNFNTTGSQQVRGESLARIDLNARNSSVNSAIGTGSINVATDAGATAIVQNAGDIVTNVPSLIPESIAGSPILLGFNFASQAAAEGSTVSGHLASGIAAHRGNPNYSAFDFTGGGSAVGTVASLARADGSNLTQAINIHRVDPTGQPAGASSVVLPTSLSDGAQTVNANGQAQFLQYMSQVGFRGPNGLVATGLNPAANAPLVAATGTESSGTEFVAAATLSGAPAWQLVAYPGKPILDGPNGAAVGSIVAASPATFSAPAADGLGNIYFVARQQFTGGGAANALIKAVRTDAGYQLELLLAEGDAFTGANSSTNYTITELRLADSDSIASGAFHAGQLIPASVTGSASSDPASPFAVGGLIVNATIEYDNAGVPEPYEAVLMIAPGGEIVTPPCPGDLNGDGIVDADDLGVLLGDFGCTGTGCQADANGDGIVDADDLGILLGAFGNRCN